MKDQYWILPYILVQQKVVGVHEGQMCTLFYEMVAFIHEAWIKPKLRTHININKASFPLFGFHIS